MRGLALGIDLGGTAIKAGVVDRSGVVIVRGERPTEVGRGVAGVVANLAAVAAETARAAGVALSELDGVGIGAPGICDGPAGVVVNAVNLGWRDVAVARLLAEATGAPAFVENDANCAALGEQWCGAAKGSRHVMLLTVGTGVGGGLILNGQIYQGFSGWAGEIGHMAVVDDGLACNCGRRGCLETVASATAIAAAARDAVATGRAPRLAEMSQSAALDTRLVIQAARDGDEPARAILAQAGTYLGKAVAALVTVLNPELVVIGGGGSAAGQLLLEPLRATVERRSMPGPASVVRVVAAQLGNDAGLIGAASLVWR